MRVIAEIKRGSDSLLVVKQQWGSHEAKNFGGIIRDDMIAMAQR